VVDGGGVAVLAGGVVDGGGDGAGAAVLGGVAVLGGAVAGWGGVVVLGTEPALLAGRGAGCAGGVVVLGGVVEDGGGVVVLGGGGGGTVVWGALRPQPAISMAAAVKQIKAVVNIFRRDFIPLVSSVKRLASVFPCNTGALQLNHYDNANTVDLSTEARQQTPNRP
jgi:hypothetical protein